MTQKIKAPSRTERDVQKRYQKELSRYHKQIEQVERVKRSKIANCIAPLKTD